MKVFVKLILSATILLIAVAICGSFPSCAVQKFDTMTIGQIRHYLDKEHVKYTADETLNDLINKAYRYTGEKFVKTGKREKHADWK